MTEPYGPRCAADAIAIQREIKAMEERIASLKKERDALLAEAVREGIREWDGWRIVPTQPAKTASFTALLDYDADLADDYIQWYRDTMEIKTTQTSLKAWAKDRGMAEEETLAMLGKVLKEGDGPGTVSLRAPKGADGDA